MNMFYIQKKKHDKGAQKMGARIWGVILSNMIIKETIWRNVKKTRPEWKNLKAGIFLNKVCIPK